MNKFLRLWLIAPIMYSCVTVCMAMKKEKLEAVFAARCNKAQQIVLMGPMFGALFDQYVFENEQAKAEAKIKMYDAYFDRTKAAFVAELDKYFEEAEIDELLVFYNTPVGKKLCEKNPLIEMAMGGAVRSVLAAIQEVIVKSGGKPRTAEMRVEEPRTSTSVIYFDDLVKKSAPASVQEVFEKVIAHEGICVVKFSATWCGPCRVYKPIFEAVAAQYAELTAADKNVEVRYIAVDIDNVEDIVRQYNIKSVPLTLFFKNGKKVAAIPGIMSKDDLVHKLQEIAVS